ncbi:MAG: response regulator [Deltaproteobacteria bacterium]|nr:response regulator [Deltaproteobacteria bacterium]
MAKRRVLVVDDDHLQLALITEILEGAGFEPVGLSSAIEALRVDLSGYAMVLADVEMPRMDGRAFIAALRDTRQCDVPFAFISGKADPRMLVTDAIKYGAEFLAKPFEAHELLELVERMAPEGSPS